MVGEGSIVAPMIQTLEAEIDEHGSVKLARPVHLARSHRALVMIMPDETASGAGECALLSGAALAEDWNNPKEDAAWNHLQTARYQKNAPTKEAAATDAAPLSAD